MEVRDIGPNTISLAATAGVGWNFRGGLRLRGTYNGGLLGL